MSAFRDSFIEMKCGLSVGTLGVVSADRPLERWSQEKQARLAGLGFDFICKIPFADATPTTCFVKLSLSSLCPEEISPDP